MSQSGSHPDFYWIDHDHFLDPAESSPADAAAGALLRDASGRMWRVRRRPSSGAGPMMLRVPLEAAILLVLLVVLVALIAASG